MKLTSPRKGSHEPSTEVGPPTAQWNFIDSFFDARRTTRRLNITLAAVVIAAFMAVAGGAVVFRTGTDTLESQLANGKERARRAKTLYNQQVGLGGDEDLPTHLKNRQDQVKAALTGDVNVAEALGGINGATTSGITITGVTIGTVSASGSTTETTRGRATTTTTAKGGTAPAGSGGPTVKITATADSYGSITAWVNSLKGLPYLENATPQWNGAPPELTVTVDASLKLAALPSRIDTLGPQIGVSIDKTTTATTKTKTTKKEHD